LFCLILNCASPASGESPEPVKVEKFPDAPDFNLRTPKGKIVHLSDYKGQVIIVNFWATWCSPCILEIPHLQAMYKELSPEGFVVLGINIDEARHISGIRPLAKKLGMEYPILLDKDRSVMNVYNPSGVLPYNLVINRKGQIYAYFEGYDIGKMNEMKKVVEEALDEKE
jgi:peroxiredoxin